MEVDTAGDGRCDGTGASHGRRLTHGRDCIGRIPGGGFGVQLDGESACNPGKTEDSRADAIRSHADHA